MKTKCWMGKLRPFLLAIFFVNNKIEKWLREIQFLLNIKIQLALSCKVWWEDLKRAGWNFLTTFSFEEKTKLSDWSLSDQLTQSNNHKHKYIRKLIIVLMPHIDLHDKKWWKTFCLWVCVIDPPQKNSRKGFFTRRRDYFVRGERRKEMSCWLTRMIKK